jgi:hypothetical protein
MKIMLILSCDDERERRERKRREKRREKKNKLRLMELGIERKRYLT